MFTAMQNYLHDSVYEHNIYAHFAVSQTEPHSEN